MSVEPGFSGQKFIAKLNHVLLYVAILSITISGKHDPFKGLTNHGFAWHLRQGGDRRHGMYPLR